MNQKKVYKKFDPNSNSMLRFQIGLAVVLIGINFAFTVEWVPKINNEKVVHEDFKDSFDFHGPIVIVRPKPKLTKVQKDNLKTPRNPEIIPVNNKTKDLKSLLIDNKDDSKTGMGLSKLKLTKPIKIKKWDPYSMKPQIRSSYPGGEDAFRRFEKKNLKYPSYAIEDDVDCLVKVKFKVGKEGKISEITILKIEEEGYGFEEEVIEMIREMPNWIPAEYNGRVVESYVYHTIVFQLDNY